MHGSQLYSSDMFVDFNLKDIKISYMFNFALLGCLKKRLLTANKM